MRVSWPAKPKRTGCRLVQLVRRRATIPIKRIAGIEHHIVTNHEVDKGHRYDKIDYARDDMECESCPWEGDRNILIIN
jgi:hypothetical protein